MPVLRRPPQLARLFQHSVLTRLTILLSIFVLMSLLGNFSSLLFSRWLSSETALADRTDDLAYRLAAITLVVQMPAKTANSQINDVLYQQIGSFQSAMQAFEPVYLENHGRSPEFKYAYGKLLTDWYSNASTALDHHVALSGIRPANPQAVRIAAETDRALSAMQQDVKRLQQLVNDSLKMKMALLHIMQTVTIVIALAAAFLLLYFLYKEIFIPINELRRHVENIRRGNLQIRSGFTATHEMGELGKSFDEMMDAIQQRLYEAQQQKEIAEQASTYLAREVEFVQFISQAMNEMPLGQAALSRILEEFERLLGSRVSLLRLDDADNNLKLTMDFKYGGEHPLSGPVAGRSEPLSVPLIHNHQHYGWLLLHRASGQELSASQIMLAHSAARLLALGIGAEYRIRESRRMTLLEERAAIARELHDSIAQALSYLKIQVSRLQALLGEQAIGEEALTVVAELREGLNSAYRNLRELLRTFRPGVIDQGLDVALKATCEEFMDKSNLSISLDYRLAGCRLSVHEEMQALLIVREALTNIVRHARATQAIIMLYHDNAHHVSIRIEDDGIGLTQVEHISHHHGLKIMQERAASINGHFNIANRATGGTEVTVTFVAAA
jgi:two-component system, NarL family, nitrate/nitrite sensor histidine kinase NarX